MEKDILKSRNTDNRMNILGVTISITNMEKTVATIFNWIENNEKHYVCVRDVHGVMESQRDSLLLDIHNQSGLTVPDGMPLVWLGHLYDYPIMGRVYGPDLMVEVCKKSIDYGYKHFFYGGNPSVAEKLVWCLKKRFPGLQIAGTFTPPFRPLNKNEEEKLISQIADSKPHFFWVGISTPKQERFMAEFLPRLSTNVMIGVGAAFDILSGRIKDAPDWMKNNGLQWLFRLYKEPRRLWKRYLYNNSLFILKISKERVFDWKKQFKN